MSLETPSDFAQVFDEHEDLIQRIKAERLFWQQLREWGVPDFGQMGLRLHDLRDRLADHLHHEERLEDEVGQHGAGVAFSLAAGRQRQEHEALLARLDAIIGRLEGCGSAFDCWGEAGEAFETFAGDLQEHEEDELRELRKFRV